jgi:hypothetical protein
MNLLVSVSQSDLSLPETPPANSVITREEIRASDTIYNFVDTNNLTSTITLTNLVQLVSS